MNNIQVDEEMYEIKLPEPSNYGKYRQYELDSQLLSAYGSADGITYMSPRFKLKRFLQMTDEEIIISERMRAEELGLDPDAGDENLPKIYGQPDDMGAGGMAGGLGGGMGGGFGGTEMGMGAGGEAGGELGGDMGGGAAPGPAGAPV